MQKASTASRSSGRAGRISVEAIVTSLALSQAEEKGGAGCQRVRGEACLSVAGVPALLALTCWHLHIDFPVHHLRFQARQRVHVVAWTRVVDLAIFRKFPAMAGAVEFTIRALPLHDAAHVRTGRRHSDDLPSILLIGVFICVYHVADNRIRGKAHSVVAKLRHCGHKEPGSRSVFCYEGRKYLNFRGWTLCWLNHTFDASPYDHRGGNRRSASQQCAARDGASPWRLPGPPVTHSSHLLCWRCLDQLSFKARLQLCRKFGTRLGIVGPGRAKQGRHAINASLARRQAFRRVSDMPCLELLYIVL